MITAQKNRRKLGAPTDLLGVARGVGSGGSVSFVVGGTSQVTFNDFARSLVRNRGVLKMDKRGQFVNGAASLVALLQQTRRRRHHSPVLSGTRAHALNKRGGEQGEEGEGGRGKTCKWEEKY